MEQKICQSCGMPMVTPEEFGTNSDGSVNKNYCAYCIKDGKFTNNLTLDEQVEIGLKYYQPYAEAKTQEEKDLVRQQSKEFLSTLRRWKNQ